MPLELRIYHCHKPPSLNEFTLTSRVVENWQTKRKGSLSPIRRFCYAQMGIRKCFKQLLLFLMDKEWKIVFESYHSTDVEYQTVVKPSFPPLRFPQRASLTFASGPLRQGANFLLDYRTCSFCSHKQSCLILPSEL